MSGGHSHDHHDHHHDHDDHAPIEEDGGEHEIVERAIRSLLIERGLITAEDFRREIEVMETRDPAAGARLVARAWVDPAFRTRLVAAPLEAARALGVETAGFPPFLVMEDGPKLHHVVVCTLCSCYPRGVLGIPPAWYKSRAYRSRVVRDPRAVLAEFGTVLADEVEIRVVDSTADLRYIVLPERPVGTEGWSEERLAGIVTRDAMIGVTLPRA